jgi:hypothetical protein
VNRFLLIAGLLAATCTVATSARAAGANPFDGEWAEVIDGLNHFCEVHLDTSFTVTNGRLIQSGSGGTVNPNGSAYGTANSGGYSATWTGHFSGNRAVGQFRRSDGCVGRWSAVRSR